MEAKELRIGNIVNFGIVLEPIIIKGITEQSSTIEMAEPIPLTEEWLLKFGFERFKNGIGWDTLKKKDFELVEVPTNKGKLTALDKGSGKYLYVKTIHQLQNLYFALTGEELTLKQ